MTKKALKLAVQDDILSAAMNAILIAGDNNSVTDEYLAVMRKELARVEKLFGYNPGTWR